MKLLRFGMVGGAIGSFIGNVHRQGAQLDDLAVLTAGSFSRNEKRNKETAELWRVDPDRIYSSYQQMAETESRREDGIDFVVIATPNKTHFPIALCFLEHGIHVSCDKPVAMTIKDAERLKSLAKSKNLHFGVSYTYVNYPMVHQMRAMIDRGDIGRILTVMAEYPQDWVINGLDAGKDVSAGWRFDPEQAGPSAATADIGSHLSCLIHRGTGLSIQRVLANLNCLPDEMPLDTNSQVLFALEDDIPGMLWASQVAIGHECGVSLRVFGDKGALEWSHHRPTRLKFTPANGPETFLTDGRTFLTEEVQSLSRIAAGHPEGFFEAFGNYYRGFCKTLLCQNQEIEECSHPHPTIEDGIYSMKFVESCLQSHEQGNVWVRLT